MNDINFRWYQSEGIEAATQHDNGILVMPTGSGKSVVCAGIAHRYADDGVLVLQPSLEILKSNLEKIQAFGVLPSVYSASANANQVGDVTYATIGSIIKDLDQFRHARIVVIDECHLVNPKGGQYDDLVKTLDPDLLIGMTATPYRQYSNSIGTNMRVMCRTRPSLFKDLIYVVNPRDLVAEGYLVNPEFVPFDQDASMLRPNTTGAEYTDISIRKFMDTNAMNRQVVRLVPELNDHNHILIFVESVEDSKKIVEALNHEGVSAAEINAKTPKKERAFRLGRFQEGDIRAMVNVGTLTTGYDFPALDCIVDARPTMSAALHYQKTGRVVRPFPDKTATVYDLAGNAKRMGNPLNYTIAQNRAGKWEVYSETGRVTTRIMTDEPEYEIRVSFGKHRGERIADIDQGYLAWGARKLRGEWGHIFFSEMKRRELFCRDDVKDLS